jgi:hypothetical protein
MNPNVSKATRSYLCRQGSDVTFECNFSGRGLLSNCASRSALQHLSAECRADCQILRQPETKPSDSWIRQGSSLSVLVCAMRNRHLDE